MAVNDLNRSTSPNNRVIAFFKERGRAYEAVTRLKEAGFDSDEIGLIYNESGSQTSAASDVSVTGRRDESFWDKLKDFFSGESHYDADTRYNYRDSISDMNWDQDRAEYYRNGIASGGALVTVAGSRAQEARRILESAGGELRETGFAQQPLANVDTADADRASRDSELPDQDYRIQLRGEVLRAYKERVRRGEVRVRKDVVTENQTIQVPVTREELVVERVPASGEQVSGEIGSDKEIRVPLSEERARVDKQPVVNEEVRIGKRAVQNTQQVSGDVRHEELKVDQEGDIDVEDAAKPRNRKTA